MRTIVRGKEHPIWVTTIDVWSRLWPSTVVRRRSYRNTLALFQDVVSRMNLERAPLIATDGLREIFLSPIVFSAAEQVPSVFVHFSILFIVEDNRLPMTA